MTERLVEDYLTAVARACAGLPTPVRVELLADLREHITVAKAELPEQTEAAVRVILARLGDPAAIAAEARASVPPVAAAPLRPAPVGPVMPMRRPAGMPPSLVALIALDPVGIVAALLILGALIALWSRA
jgi:hypothetical protein